MNGFTVALIVILGIIGLLSLLMLMPLFFRIMAHVDLLHNHMFFSVRLFGLSFYSATLRVHGNRLFLIPKSGKQIALKIVAPSSDKDAIASYLPPNLPAVKLHKLNLYVEAGKSDDAFVSAMLLALIQSATLSLIALAKNRFPDMQADTDYRVEYNIDHLQSTVNCILSMNFADIIYAIVATLTFHRKATSRPRKNAKT